MRFCHPFTLITSSRDGKQALARHRRIGAKSSDQCDQPPFIVLFPRTIFLQPIARPTKSMPRSPSRDQQRTACPRNLTEFPFGRCRGNGPRSCAGSSKSIFRVVVSYVTVIKRPSGDLGKGNGGGADLLPALKTIRNCGSMAGGGIAESKT
jgi:hypothetical protein